MDQNHRTRGTVRRIGMTDVHRIESGSHRARTLDYRYGGGSGKETALRELRRAHALLEAPATEQVKSRLYTAAADLHSLTGWIMFDLGQLTTANACFTQALRLAHAADNTDLLANIHYRMGRIHLHHGDPARAVAHFERGAAFADANKSALAMAILSANQAWAHAVMGRTAESLRQLGNAIDTFTQTTQATTPPWAAFFDNIDLTAMAGIVYTMLARRVDNSYTSFAIPALTTAVTGYGDAMARSRTFALIALAVGHLIGGDPDEGTKIGAQAVEAAARLASTRVVDRMRPLREEARRRVGNTDARDLAERISRLTTSKVPPPTE
jgi:tetratricopeptide (TPR) repeat protein